MPLREQNRSTEPSSSIERWLRQIFVEDWSLKLLALAITLVLWFLISARASQ